MGPVQRCAMTISSQRLPCIISDTRGKAATASSDATSRHSWPMLPIPQRFCGSRRSLVSVDAGNQRKRHLNTSPERRRGDRSHHNPGHRGKAPMTAFMSGDDPSPSPAPWMCHNYGQHAGGDESRWQAMFQRKVAIRTSSAPDENAKSICKYYGTRRCRRPIQPTRTVQRENSTLRPSRGHGGS